MLVGRRSSPFTQIFKGYVKLGRGIRLSGTYPEIFKATVWALNQATKTIKMNDLDWYHHWHHD